VSPHWATSADAPTGHDAVGNRRRIIPAQGHKGDIAQLSVGSCPFATGKPARSPKARTEADPEFMGSLTYSSQCENWWGGINACALRSEHTEAG
jgi:hypothetical protein